MGFAPAGDSRAVLCRSGVAIPLTDDHKAAREDETVGNYMLLSQIPKLCTQISMKP